jgi:16S rRNA (cytosine1402-N4)-methyltransferase
MVNYHQSVMSREVLGALYINKSAKIIDATLGTGGHSKMLLEAGCDVLGIEADPRMLTIARQRIPNGNFVLGNFVDIDKIAAENGYTEVDGVLFDLGVSNLHLKEDGRGFSFSNPNQELDMRLNRDLQAVKASDLLNVLDKTQLTNLFARVMKLPDARKIAEKVMNNRPVNTVNDLEKIVGGLSLLARRKTVHPMTLPMLALRIAVNSELENLKIGLEKAYGLLKKGGVLAVITFHSTEDNIVLEFGHEQKIMVPGENEINKNPRSRSARLRIIEKV